MRSTLRLFPPKARVTIFNCLIRMYILIFSHNSWENSTIILVTGTKWLLFTFIEKPPSKKVLSNLELLSFKWCWIGSHNHWNSVRNLLSFPLLINCNSFKRFRASLTVANNGWESAKVLFHQSYLINTSNRLRLSIKLTMENWSHHYFRSFR